MQHQLPRSAAAAVRALVREDHKQRHVVVDGHLDTPALAAHAFDVAVWRFGHPRTELNFRDVESREVAKFLTPDVRIVTRKVEQENRRAFVQLRIRRDDEATMERFRRDHPDLVQAQLELDAERDAKM